MAKPFEIDYSNIAEPVPAPRTSWRPPRHVFFGKRNPEDGVMEEEPTYVYQEYPRMLYSKRDGKIVASIVNSDEERDGLLAKGWALTPAAFGHLTAPSFEEHQAMLAEQAAVLEKEESEKTEEPETVRRGRPRKVV